MSRRSSFLLALSAFAFTSSIAEGAVVPRPPTSRTVAAQRVVELRLNRLPTANADNAVERNDDTINTNTAEEGGSSSSSYSKVDGILFPSPISHNPRHLVLDGIDSELVGDGGLHERLSTLYSGEIPSASLEFTLRNHRNDGRFAIISGLGLHVRQVAEDADKGAEEGVDEPPGASTAPTPCRIKMYTKRNVADASNIETDTITAEASLYQLALDAQVLCAGEGKETLLNSDLLLRNYREVFQEDIIGDVDNYEATAEAAGAYGSHGITEEEGIFPLLVPPNIDLSLYVVVLPVDTSNGMAFQLLSSTVDAASSVGKSNDGKVDLREAEKAGYLYTSDASLKLFTGSSIINGFLVNLDDPSSTPGTKDEESGLKVQEPTVFNGAVYYDVFNPDHTSLQEYYDNLEYSNGLPGCEMELSTGYHETVGSYGFMFDVSSNIAPSEVGSADGEDKDFSKQSKNVEIYGMDLNIINPVNTSFEVYVRISTTAAAATKHNTYTSYLDPAGQTFIGQNWEMIASGIVKGQGAYVGSPIPADSWHKNIIIPPGETVGFYVTVKDVPYLRYRNTKIPEGNTYKSDGILNVAVGRSWGEYPLKGDGTDEYFSPREFSGAFRYHVHEGLCYSESPSMAPSEEPTSSNAPTELVEHSYAKIAEKEGMCPTVNMLATMFEDDTGSYGGLFDVLAKTDLTLTGIDLNLDWNTGDLAHVLIYARNGTWFGKQNNADSWPYLLVNTTIHRPPDFHNQTRDGPYIPIDSKRMSAIVPRGDFKPLEMKYGETWSLYICTSLADFRYSLGTSIGKTVTSNPELSIMEGAGAADYPPFHGGTPEDGGVQYTFYAPRVFNGNLRYDFVSECPSESPTMKPTSSFNSTLAPTVTPTLTTTVSFTFYVEHSPDKSKGAVTHDMELGVRAVLDGFLGGGDEILHGYKQSVGLMIERVMANMVSPTEIGYLCYPTPPEICTPISVDVTVRHHAKATTDEITFALLHQSTHLPKFIDVDGYTIEYVGDHAVETDTSITITGVPDREMIEKERHFFEEVTREFLGYKASHPDASGNDSLRILSVTVDGQEITNAALDTTNEEAAASLQKRNNRRRRLKKSNRVKVSVKGKYRPPPEVDFGELVDDSINGDRQLLEKKLKDWNPAPVQDATFVGDVYNNYFEEAEVVGSRKNVEEQITKKKTKAEKFLEVLNHEVETEEDGSRDLLNFAAMVVGGAIILLSLVFFLRPHRRRAMFSFSYRDKRAHRSTAIVDADHFTNHDNSLQMGTKNHAMIRGESLDDSGNSFPDIGSDKAAFNPSGSNTSLLSHFSDGAGLPGGGGIDTRDRGISMGSSDIRGRQHPMNGSFGPPPGGLGECNLPMDNSELLMRGGQGGLPERHMNRAMNSHTRRPAGESTESPFQPGPMGGRGPPPPRGVHPDMGGLRQEYGFR